MHVVHVQVQIFTSMYDVRACFVVCVGVHTLWRINRVTKTGGTSAHKLFTVTCPQDKHPRRTNSAPSGCGPTFLSTPWVRAHLEQHAVPHLDVFAPLLAVDLREVEPRNG